LKIEHIAIGKVKLNPDNPRQISNKDFKSLVKSLHDCSAMFEARPLLCSNRTGKLIILGGNMRLLAAQKLNYKEVPVIILPGLTEAQEKEITIKDNGAWGQWDFDALANAWSGLPLKDWGINIPTFIDPNTEWEGMPEFDNPAKAFKSISVHFENQKNYNKFCKLIDQELTEETNSIWYPEKKRRDMKGVMFENES
jgi:hypothetical protein